MLALVMFSGISGVLTFLARRYYPRFSVAPSSDNAVFERLAEITEDPLLILKMAVSGMMEEFVFTMPVIAAPEKYRLIAMAISATLFTLAHVGYPRWILPQKAVFNLVSCFLGLRYGFVTCLAMHFTNNMVAGYVGLVRARILRKQAAAAKLPETIKAELRAALDSVRS